MPSKSQAAGTALAVLTLLFVSGCAVPVVRPPVAELEHLWQRHAATLVPVTQWQLRGRLAIRTGERGGQASLNWERAAARHSIRLNGPLGRGVVRVTQDAGGARLVDAEQRVHEAASAEELLFYYTGWRLPLDYLDYWVRGLPVPGLAASHELDESGRLRTLRQAEWEVRFQGYARVDSLDLPTQLTLNRNADALRPGMEARLVIDRWVQVK